jgi:hypothetical protein
MDTKTCERFMKDPVEMGSGAISGFIKIGSDIQKFMGGCPNRMAIA